MLLLLLLDPRRWMGAGRETMEPQKPGNSPRSGPEFVDKQRITKVRAKCKESVAGQWRIR